MATRTLGVDLNKDGILTVAFCPGWVKTDLGGPNAPGSAEESVASIIKSIRGLNKESQGVFMNKEGKVYPW